MRPQFWRYRYPSLRLNFEGTSKNCELTLMGTLHQSNYEVITPELLLTPNFHYVVQLLKNNRSNQSIQPYSSLREQRCDTLTLFHQAFYSA